MWKEDNLKKGKSRCKYPMEMQLSKKSLSKLQELAGLTLQHQPVTISTSDRTPGRKAWFDLPLKENPKNLMTDYLHVFAESKLTDKPKDELFGFTQEDVSDSSGVYVFKKRKNGLIEGETFSIEHLLTGIITDMLLQTQILQRVQKLRQMVHLDDEFLGYANLEWQARENDEVFGFTGLN